MFSMAISLLSFVFLSILLVFTARRVVFTLRILFRSRKGSFSTEEPGRRVEWPEVLVLAPCHDEESEIAGLVYALEKLDYPAEKLRVVLVDDGSRDKSRILMECLAQQKANWDVFALSENVGKALALNAALARHSFGDIVYVVDADHRPLPDALKRAMSYFDDPQVAGVSGRTLPVNPLGSPSAYYATVEAYITQMVTMRAKDRLDLGPALLGSNCGYRRDALLKCGGFRDRAFSEDSDITVSLYRAGYRVRFGEDVISYHQVPQSVKGYLRQHMRWARGLNEVALIHSVGLIRSERLPIPLRIELLLFSLGYLDRIAVAGTIVLTAISFLDLRRFGVSAAILCFALLVPLAQIIAIFLEQRLSWKMWLRLPWLPVYFCLDIVGAIRAAVDSALNRRKEWLKTERV